MPDLYSRAVTPCAPCSRPDERHLPPCPPVSITYYHLLPTGVLKLTTVASASDQSLNTVTVNVRGGVGVDVA